MTQLAQTIVEKSELSGEVDFVLLEPAIKRSADKGPPVIRILPAKSRGTSAPETEPASRVKYDPEEIIDLLRLLAMIALISLIHHFVPNNGKAPHSIGDVVQSTAFFPG